MSDWPDHVKYDVSIDAYMRRMDRLKAILEERGGFIDADAHRALLGNPEVIEEVAKWLRQELASLRDAEKKVGKAPVLMKGALSRTDISDLAITMLSEDALGLQEEPQDELIALLAELLDVDRHRRAMAKTPSEAMITAAQNVATIEGIGVRELAKFVGIAPSTVSAWRKDPEYKQQVERWKRFYAGPSIKAILCHFAGKDNCAAGCAESLDQSQRC